MPTFPLIIEINNSDGPVTKFSLPVGETIDIYTRYNYYPAKFSSHGVCITIPEGVRRIEKYTFRDYRSLTSVTIPEGVTTITKGAFQGCSSLVSVTLPEGLKSIEWGAFQGCRSLASVSIPEGVTFIGDIAFKGCSSLASVVIPEGVTILQRAFQGCKSLSSVTIPAGETKIGTSTFQRCSSLASVIIPEGVTEIGKNAFDGCSSLVSAVLPQSCNFIHENAFKNCPRLSLVVAPDVLAVRRLNQNLRRYVADGSIASVFPGCPLLNPPAYTTPRTPEAIIAARRLEYWTPTTHQLCQPTRREWVKFVILVFHRLEIPSVPRLKILKMLKRYELGP